MCVYTYILTAHEERRHEIYADERYAEVDGATERGDRGHGGRDVAHESEHRFAAHPVGHHARDDGEHGHEDERGREIRYHRSRVVLQFDVQGARTEPCRGYVTESPGVFGVADRVQERFFPHGTPAAVDDIIYIYTKILRRASKTVFDVR